MKTSNSIPRSAGFPTIPELVSDLKRRWQFIRRNWERKELKERGEDFAGTDVRLRVYNGNWYVYTGSSDYDQDHRGAWGASCLSYDRQNLTDLARDLIEQAKDQWVDNLDRGI
jgi:hypothetical protein